MNTKRFLILLFTLLSLFISSYATASLWDPWPVTEAWNESTDGDLLSGVAGSATDLGVLGYGYSDIVGSLNAGPSGAGNGPDETDAFLITVGAPWELHVFNSSEYTDFLIFAYGENDPIPLGGMGYDIGGGPYKGLFYSNEPGTFMVVIGSLSNSGTLDYTVRIENQNPVPLPATAWLLLTAIGGLLGVNKWNQRKVKA